MCLAERVCLDFLFHCTQSQYGPAAVDRLRLRKYLSVQALGLDVVATFTIHELLLLARTKCAAYGYEELLEDS